MTRVIGRYTRRCAVRLRFLIGEDNLDRFRELTPMLVQEIDDFSEHEGEELYAITDKKSFKNSFAMCIIAYSWIMQFFGFLGFIYGFFYGLFTGRSD